MIIKYQKSCVKIALHSFWGRFRFSKQFPHLKTKSSSIGPALRIFKFIFMYGVCVMSSLVCTCENQSPVSDVSFCCSPRPRPHLLFESGSLLEPRGHRVQWDWPPSLRDPSVFTCPVHGFLCGCSDLNLGFQAYTASTLPTESSSQP